MTMWLLLGSLVLTLSLFFRYKWIFFLVATGAFALYFQPISQNISLFLIFMIGISLLIAELYIPDFGVMGIVGTIILIFSIYQKNQNLSVLVMDSLWVILLVSVVITMFLSIGREIQLSQRFVLNTALSNENGYTPNKQRVVAINQLGVVVETLRPVGKVKLAENSEFLEVISEEGQISIGSEVYISKVQGTKYFVRLLK